MWIREGEPLEWKKIEDVPQIKLDMANDAHLAMPRDGR
jgi:hypothetical protein